MLDTWITQEHLQYVHALIDLRSAYVTQFFHLYKPRLIIMHKKESSFHSKGHCVGLCSFVSLSIFSAHSGGSDCPGLRHLKYLLWQKRSWKTITRYPTITAKRLYSWHSSFAIFEL